MFLVPLQAIQDNFVGRFLASEHRRKQDAVVIDVRLVAKDGDLKFRGVLQNLLDAGHSRHTVSHDHELLHHRGPVREWGMRFITTPALLPSVLV